MLPQELKGLGREGLEEWARGEFERGAECGSEVAGGMARGLNPVRKLCGRIVGEMMRGEMGWREWSGEGGGGGDGGEDEGKEGVVRGRWAVGESAV